MERLDRTAGHRDRLVDGDAADAALLGVLEDRVDGLGIVHPDRLPGAVVDVVGVELESHHPLFFHQPVHLADRIRMRGPDASEERDPVGVTLAQLPADPER